MPHLHRHGCVVEVGEEGGMGHSTHPLLPAAAWARIVRQEVREGHGLLHHDAQPAAATAGDVGPRRHLERRCASQYRAGEVYMSGGVASGLGSGV